MATPEKIGRYEIIARIGARRHGGCLPGPRSIDGTAGGDQAAARQLTFNESLRNRFQREAGIVASLEHPAIVPVHDFGEFNEQPYLVMRYMVGGSLSEHTNGKSRSALPEVVRILSPLSQALDKAHSHHIIHRDLKPDNILFDGDRNPYLSDFGIARLAEGTQTTSIMGTPAYMSPEQIKGDVELDGRSDIYALGVILFEMLSGEQPYTAETPTQIMMKHVLEPVPRDPRYGRRFAADDPGDYRTGDGQGSRRSLQHRRRTAGSGVKRLLTASQAAEVGAAMAGTMLQETMLEIPAAESDPMATVVEPIHTPGIAEIEREAQAAAFMHRLQAAVAAKDWPGVLAIGASLQQVDPNYRDVQVIIAEAKMQQANWASPPPERTAAVEPAVVEADLPHKASPSRGRQVLLIGCVIGIGIVLCLLALGVYGYFAAAEVTTDASTPGGSQTAAAAEYTLPGILFSDSFDAESASCKLELVAG